MTDKGDDRREPGDDRRQQVPPPPDHPDGVNTPVRRTGDDMRVRAAIRSELQSDKVPGAMPTKEWRAQSPNKVIELEHVYLAFDEPVLEDISFVALEGETVVVAGESGSGKSIMLKLLLRLLVPDRGKVFIDGEEITQLNFTDALKVRQKMGMVFQSSALFDSMTVYENIAYPLREHTDMSEADIETRVREKLSFVDLDPDKVMEQLPSELSGGMRKRVGIARGMANNPKIMLYDEPTSGLDPLTTATITHLIIKLQRELGVTSIVVTHDIRSAFKMASKIAVLAEKKIVFFGTPEEMSGSDDRYLRDFLGGF
ncbi:MAG: ATP-binding cassette domain-containing protein [Gemmatimonadaceae bacterium]|nr:ATP-binding cassette domain-containing protein [Gemmatimonadaceae bacterium]